MGGYSSGRPGFAFTGSDRACRWSSQKPTVAFSWTRPSVLMVSLGAPRYDDLYIDGFRTYYQPIPITA